MSQFAELKDPDCAKAKLPLRQKWMAARGRRDFSSVESIGSLILSKGEDEPIRRSLARLLDELGREKDALAHWQRLNALRTNDLEASFHVTKCMVRNGYSTENAIRAACPLASSNLKHNLAALLNETQQWYNGNVARHIALCGTSYSGSTLIDRLLGGLPGVRSIGESHWLIKAHYPHGYDLANFSSDILPPMVPCTVCKQSCPILTFEFRRAMAADHTNWYSKIADRLKTDILISADKNWPKLIDNDPLLRLDALVLFKSPLQAWASTFDKLPTGRDSSFYVAECEKYLSTWTRSYGAFLDLFVPQGKVVFLHFDSFAEYPEKILPAVCKALSLTYDHHVLEAVTPGHAIGGNSRALKRLRANGYAMEIRSLPKPSIPPEQLKVIFENEGVQQIYARMLDKFKSMANVSG